MTHRIRNHLPIVALSVGYILLASQATDAMMVPCVREGEFLEKVINKWGEQPEHVGITQAGETMTIYSNIKTRTWTIAVAKEGVACMLAVGVDFSAMKQGVPL